MTESDETNFDQICREALEWKRKKDDEREAQQQRRARWQKLLHPVRWLCSRLHSSVRWDLVILWSLLGAGLVVLLAVLARG